MGKSERTKDKEQNKEKNKAFGVRFRSAFIVTLLTLIFLYIGGPICAVALCGVSIKGLQELLRVNGNSRNIFGVVSYVTTGIYYSLFIFNYFGLLPFDLKYMLVPLMVIYLLVLLIAYVFSFPKYKDSNVMFTFASFFYVTVMLSYIYQIRCIDENGFLYTGLIYASAWGCDVFAYLFGMTFGKHKMAPILSPKKSIEGAIGGIFGSALFGVLYASLYTNFVAEMKLAYIIYPTITALGAIPAMIGDLAASAIKRNHDVKDYGKLLPGHGGILDRFDSLIFTAPIVYFLLMIFR